MSTPSYCKLVTKTNTTQFWGQRYRDHFTGQSYKEFIKRRRNFQNGQNHLEMEVKNSRIKSIAEMTMVFGHPSIHE